MSTVHNRDKVKVDIKAHKSKFYMTGNLQGCAGMQNDLKYIPLFHIMTHDPPKYTDCQHWLLYCEEIQ